jgi:predicted DNA-binding protein
MYTYIMVRTQIYLSDEEARALEREARATGRTKSRLIRDAIDRLYLAGSDSTEVLRALRRSAGAWRRRESGAAYAERLRSGRLARIHSR